MKYPPRFYKKQTYIGIENSVPLHQAHTYTDKPRLSIKRFNGRPYNKYEFESIIEYDPVTWNNLVDKIKARAKTENMGVRVTDNHVFSVPIWV